MTMRFAFKTSPQNTTWDAMLAVWRAADDIDVFESGWTFDHFYPIFSDPTGPCMEGWITLTALAQATARLRVGVLVTGNVYRHPAVLANMAATLDIVSDGRLELGIGAGWNQEECDAYGIELPPLKERFDRFDEALEVDRRPAFERDHRLRRAATTQLTAPAASRSRSSSPHPPICIGGTGPRRTLPAVGPLGPALEPPRRVGRGLAQELRDPGRALRATSAATRRRS